MRRALSALFTIAVLAVLSGCAKEPTPEVRAAREAMESADAAGAPDYAPDSWAAARDAQSKLDAEVEAQRNLSALARSYEQTRLLAAEAKSAAEEASEAAVTGKATARDDSQKAIEEVKALRDEVSRMVEHAPQGKGAVADLAALRADMAGTEATVKDAEDAFAAGRYVEARTRAGAAKQALEAVKGQIRSAERSRRT